VTTRPVAFTAHVHVRSFLKLGSFVRRQSHVGHVAHVGELPHVFVGEPPAPPMTT
jgi:hypothetical protein